MVNGKLYIQGLVDSEQTAEISNLEDALLEASEAKLIEKEGNNEMREDYLTSKSGKCKDIFNGR